MEAKSTATTDGPSAFPFMGLAGRENLAVRRAERWAPRAHSPVGGPMSALRAFCDLQFGSILRDAREFLPTAHGRLLDVGCGAQPFRPLVPAGVQYLGIDYRGAADNFGYQIPDTIYFDGLTWPIEDSSFDFVLCTEVLEHILDPLAFLKEARRVIAPGGCLFLTVPFAARWHYIPHDYWRFTPSCLHQLLASVGFATITVHARGNELTVASYKAMGLMLPFLFPQGGSVAERLARRLAGVAMLPIFALLALVGNLSLGARAGDDCLGYTVLAMPPPPTSV